VSPGDEEIEYRVRPEVSSDEINALRREAWQDVGDQDWARVLAVSVGWVCAFAGGRLVGFVNVAGDGGSHAFLLDTTVHPEYQRRGIGAALVKEAARLSREAGAEWLHVDYETDVAGFYRACGFRATEAGLLDLDLPP
jgi:ribosomal protein S18 acetylase RimI-like enzyme